MAHFWNDRRAKFSLIVRYALFGGVAICGNLLTQRLFDRFSGVQSYPLSLISGTAVGFAIKYALDKHWIFHDPIEWHSREVIKAGLYGAFSVFTTAIFWTAETIAWFTWQTPTARYVGAAIGLLIGYVIKYNLDRNITFRAARTAYRR